MKILHVITTIDSGGAEKQLLTLVRSQIRAGSIVKTCFIKGRGDLGDVFAELGCNVYRLSPNLRGLLKLRELLRVFQPDIVHAHLPLAEIFSSLMKGSTPLVCSKHNAEQFWPNRNRQISKLMSRFFSSRAFAIVAISQGVKVFLLTSAEVRPDSNIEVIHYGFDDSKPLEEVRLIPKRTSLRFLCVSRLTEQKDIPTLLKAFAAYNKQFKDSTLTIVGDGDLRHFLIELSEVLGIADSIKWVRHVLQIDELYKTHDCLVLTSKYEGFGMVLLEAMQSGLPILCSSNSTSKEVLGGSHPGLFEVGDFLKLSKLMSQTHKAEIYSQNSTLSRERIFAFDPNCSFEKMQRLYCRAKS